MTWKPIANWPEYQVCDDGRIRNALTGRVLKPTKCGTLGHMKVTLCSGASVRRQVLVHRVVCEAFHGPPPTPKHQAAHWDGNASNNRAENVRWATKSENEADKVLHGRSNRGTRNGMAKLTEADVVAIRAAVANGAKMKDLSLAYGVRHSTISGVASGKRWKHVGAEHEHEREGEDA